MKKPKVVKGMICVAPGCRTEVQRNGQEGWLYDGMGAALCPRHALAKRPNRALQAWAWLTRVCLVSGAGAELVHVFFMRAALTPTPLVLLGQVYLGILAVLSLYLAFRVKS